MCTGSYLYTLMASLSAGLPRSVLGSTGSAVAADGLGPSLPDRASRSSIRPHHELYPGTGYLYLRPPPLFLIISSLQSQGGGTSALRRGAEEFVCEAQLDP
jgi:hypothetical protein